MPPAFTRAMCAPTPSNTTSSSSPMKRARKMPLQQLGHVQLATRRRRLRARDFFPLKYVSAWLRRFTALRSRVRKERAATALFETRDIGDSSSDSGIWKTMRTAVGHIRARWQMTTTATLESADLTSHKDTLALFAPRRNALFAMSEGAMELALAPMFYCCIAMDRVAQRPTTLPTTSVFSASVVSFVLKVFTVATELRRKHLLGASA